MPILQRLSSYKDEAYTSDGSEFGSLPEALLFAIEEMIVNSAQLHFCHFRTKSGYVHETLGELYSKYNDWADDLMETQLYPELMKVQLQTPHQVTSCPDKPHIMALGIVDQTCGRLDGVKEMAEQEGETGVANICENIIVELERYMYKLKNLK